MIYRVEFQDFETKVWKLLGVYGDKYHAQDGMREMVKAHPDAVLQITKASGPDLMWAIEYCLCTRYEPDWKLWRAFSTPEKAGVMLARVRKLNPVVEFRVKETRACLR